MYIASYIHPSRTYLPATGVGRHINNLLLALHNEKEVDLRLLYSKQWLNHGMLPQNAPLREIAFSAFGLSERWMEWSWKALNWPKMDHYIKGADWMFSPMETRFPTTRLKTAITIHDIQAFENGLPWSNTIEHKKFQKRWQLWVKKACDQANLVFTVSEFSRQRLINELKLPEEKVRISGNAVDPFFLLEAENIQPKNLDHPYLVVIGGLRPKKGGRELLKVAQKLRQRWPELRLITWGENDPKLMQQARAVDNITVLDMISDVEMISWLKGAQASLFLSWYEGFGLPVLESMACGIPVICSDKASLPEVAGDAALLASPNEIDRITDHILQIKSSSVANELIKKGFRNCERYSWKQASENVISALRNY